MSYLPGTKIRYAWDSTCIGAFKTCPRYYYLSIVEGWTAKNENIHLRFGIEFHKTLNDYDISIAQGARHDDAVHYAIRALLERTLNWEVDPNAKHAQYKNKFTLRQLAIDYLDHYRDDPAKTFIKSDGTPAIEVSFQFNLDRTLMSDESQPLIICGHLDKVVTFNDHLFVKDTKTSMKTLGDEYFNQYEPNNQMTLYTIAGKVVLKTEIRGVIIDAGQILLTKESRFVRGITYRTQDQMDEWLGDLSSTLDTAELCASNNHWPQNDMACRFCQFREVCSTSPHARERFLKADFIQLPEEERWDPLKPR